MDVLPLSDNWKEWVQGKGKHEEAGSVVKKWEPITVRAYVAMKFEQAKYGGKNN